MFGVSAGGGNVLEPAASPPQARGLFQRAISQSAPLYSYSVTEAQAYTEDGGLQASSAETLARLLVAAGRAGDRAAARALAARMDATETASFLRAQSPEALVRALIVERPPGDDRPPEFATVVRDGAGWIPVAAPFDLFARGAYNRVPLADRHQPRRDDGVHDRQPRAGREGRMGVPQVKDANLYAVLVEYRSEAWRASTVHVLGPCCASSARACSHIASTGMSSRDSLRATSERCSAPPTGSRRHSCSATSTAAVARASRSPTKMPRGANGSLPRCARTGPSSRCTATRAAGGRASLPDWKPWSDTDKYMLLDTADGGGLRMERNAATVNRLLYGW